MHDEAPDLQATVESSLGLTLTSLTAPEIGLLSRNLT